MDKKTKATDSQLRPHTLDELCQRLTPTTPVKQPVNDKDSDSVSGLSSASGFMLG